jgi:hypothetical protein
MSDQIIEVTSANWQGQSLSVPRKTLLEGIEQGKVLYFPNLAFPLEEGESRLLDPSIADPKRKNISLDANGTLHGVQGDAPTQVAASAMIARYQANARALVAGLFPEYTGKLRVAPTSLRVHEVKTRQNESWRKDDARLHVDAFPSRPTHGERILRVFTNINPNGAPRVWRVGEPFEDMARRFLPGIKPQVPGSAWLQNLLHITKTPRTAYDHLMLHLHDDMKEDMNYQQTCAQVTIPFPPGCVWVCFADHATHAVMSGQFMMEQTFFLPVKAMAHPEWSPLGVLERLTGKELV